MSKLSRNARVSAARVVSARAAAACLLAAGILVVAISAAFAMGLPFTQPLASVVFGAGGAASPEASQSATPDKESQVSLASAALTGGALNAARSGHTATRLADGRVLIAGGDAAGTAEVYDPVSGVSATTGNLIADRSRHAAFLLADGRVLVAGGSVGGTSAATTEIYDPSTGTFSTGPSMTSPRSGHTATRLNDGSILIAGGGTDTAEKFDGVAFTAIAAAMTTSRAGHSAALMNDGRVLIVGGSSADGEELQSAEIFDPVDQTFNATGSSMAHHRSGAHLRVLPDGKVQIIGGSDDLSMEVYDPAIDTIGAHAHLVPVDDEHANLMRIDILSAQTRAALFYNGQTDPLVDRSAQTITELGSTALVAGGIDSSGAAINSFSTVGSSSATVTTDKLDYAPGQTAVISGTNWQPGEIVEIVLHEDPHTHTERRLTATADANGAFRANYPVEQHDLNVTFIVGAKGQSSGRTAQTTFTDAATDPTPQPLPYSQDFSTLAHNSNTYPAGWQGWTLGSTSTTSFRTNSPLENEALQANRAANNNNTGVSNYSGKIGILAGGSSTTDPSLALALNTTGFSSIQVAFDIMTIRNPYDGSSNNRINQVDLQYRVCPTSPTPCTVSFGSVTNLANGIYQNNTTTQTSNTTAPQNSQAKSFTLPADANNQPIVHIRWVQRDVSGNGFRPSFAVDNISVSGAAACTAAIVTTHPTNQTVTYGQNAVFAAAASGSPAPSVLWEVSTDGGGTWTSTGVTTSTLTLTTPTVAMSGYKYRAVFTNTCGGTQTATSDPATLTVNQKTVSGSFTVSSKVYDGSTSAAILTRSINSADIVGGDVVTLTGGTATFDTKSVGNGKTVTGTGFTLGGAQAANYTLGTVATTTANITALAITCDAAVNSKVYDGTTSATISGRTLTGVIAPDAVTCTGGTAAFADKNVGTGKTVNITGLSLTGADSGNYTVNPTDTASADITPKGLTISGAVALGKVYDRTTSAAVSFVSASLIGVIAPDVVTIDSSAYTASFATKDVGTAKSVTVSGVTLGGAGAGNYTVSQPAGLTADITAKGLTLTGASGVDRVYNGLTNASVNFTAASLTGVIAPDVVGFDTAGYSASFADKSVGSAKPVTVSGIVLNGADAGNYSVTQPAGLTANITALGITGSFTAENKTYDGTTAASVLTRSLTGSISGDAVSLAGGTAAFADKHVGSGKTVTLTGATLDGADAGNYTLGSVAAATANITQRAITVTAEDNSKTYGDSDPALTYQVTAGSLATGDAFTGAVARGAGENFATYSIGQGSLAIDDANGGGNYALTFVAGTFTIGKRSITIKADDKSKTYGSSDPALTHTVTGGSLAFSDTVTGSLTRAAGENVGSYAITQGSLAISDGNGGANYTLTFNNGSLQIDALTVTVTPTSDQTKVYGSADPALAYGFAPALAFSDTFSGALARDAGEGVGQYDITQGTLALSSNYVLNFAAGVKFTVTAKALTASITSSDKTYDGTAAAAFTCSLTGVVGTDDVSCTGGTATFDTANVGTGKTVTVNGLGLAGAAAGNYTVNSSATDTADITALGLTITGAAAQNKVYDGGTAAAVSFTGATLATPIAGDDVSIDASGYSASFGDKSVGSGKPVTVSGVTLSGAQAANYTVAQPSGLTANITPKMITATVTADNKTYDGSAAATISGCSLTGVIDGDSVGCVTTGYSASFADANAGLGKAVTATGLTKSGADAANYSFDGTGTGTADIGKASSTTTITISNATYNGLPHGGTATVTGAGGLSTTVAITYSGRNGTVYAASTTPPTNAGDYTASASYAGDANHEPSNDTKDFSIAKANQTITFTGAPATAIYNTNFAVTATSDSGLAVTVTSSGACSNVGTTVTMTSGTGTCSLRASQGGDANYNAAEDQYQTTTAQKAAATIVLSDLEHTYDATPKSATATATADSLAGAMNELTSLSVVSITYDSSPTAPTNAGSYAVAATLTNDNYEAEPATGTLVINKRSLSVTADDKTITFGDADPTFTFAYGAFAGSDGDTDIDTPPTCGVAGPHSNAGSYTIACSGGSDNNYSFSFTDGTLTINKAASTTTLTFEAGPYVYRGTAFTASANVTGAGGLNEAVSVVYSGDCTNVTTTDGCTATATYAESANHLGSVDTKSITITQAPVTATAGSGSAIYDGSSKSPGACVVSGTYKGDLACTNDPATVGPGAGTYPTAPSVTGTGLGNFAITSVAGSYEIAQAASTTVVTCPPSVVYNGAAQTPCSVSVTGAGGLSLTPDASYLNNLNVGTATASYTFTGDANHTGSDDSETFGISKAPVTATAGSGSAIYNAMTHSPSACIIGGTYTGDLTCANVPASVGPAAGTTTITPTVSGTGLSNFEITSTNGSFTINKADATIVVNGYSGTYDGTSHGASGTATGVEGESLAGLDLGSSFTNVPGGTASWTFTDETGNYNNASGTAGIVINQAPLTITASSHTVTYGDVAPTVTPTYDGFVTGEGPANLTSLPVCSTTYTQGSAAGGSYTTSCSGAAGVVTGNYAISYVNGTVTVNKATPTISVTGGTFTYDGMPHAASGFAYGLGGVGDVLTPAVTISYAGSGSTVYPSSPTAPTGAGTYVATASYAGSTNYSANSDTAALTIEKAGSTVTVSAANAQFDGSAHGATASWASTSTDGQGGGLTVSYVGINSTSYGPTNTPPTNAGDYRASASFDGDANHTGSSNHADYSITKAPSVVAITCPASVTYNGSPQSPCTAEATGVAMSPIDLTSAITYGDNTNAGTASADVTWSGDANHNGNSDSETFNIAKADANCVVTGFSGQYDGGEHGASGTCTGLGGASDVLTGLVVATTTYRNVPGGAVHWTFTHQNYADESGDATVTITAKPVVVTATAGQTKVYGDADPTFAYTTDVPLIAPDSFTGALSRAAGQNAGTYAINLGSLAVNDGNSGGNYALTFSGADFTITKRTLTLTAQPNTKTYDGTTSAAATPTIVGLQYSDTVTGLTETYDTKHAGTGKTLSVATYTVNDGNSGNNYAVSTVANTNGTIDRAPLTITAVTNTKVFDNTTSAAAIPTVGGLQSGDSVTGLSETYDNPSVGSGKTLSVASYTVEDGNSGGNYNVSTVVNTTGVITLAGTTTSVTVSPASQQYSDSVTLTAYIAAINPALNSLGAGSVQFCIDGVNFGSPVTAAFTLSGGTATLNFNNQLAPGDHTVTAKFISTNANLAGSMSSASSPNLTITREDARVFYNGMLFVNTSCATCGNATVQLAATVKDITAVLGDLAYDPNAGNIANATLTFVNRDSHTDIATVPISLVSAGDTTSGTAVYNWNVNIGSADSLDYTIGIRINGYYTRDASTDDEVITVSKPIGTNFITGGGHLVMTSPTGSAGQYAGVSGAKVNFGFNVKYNNSGRNLQGRINVIVRGANGRVYQVKGNQMDTLTVNNANPASRTAVYTGKCNLTDITDSLNPISLGGGHSFQMKLTDKGEPGSTDTIGITVYANNTGALLFSSRWNGTQTLEQILGGGNLVVR
ncbi:MAG: YDG domain-containing protein [Pyrinomonadaceae bacterium]